METVKIFLASSRELKAERDAVFKYKEEVGKNYPHLKLEIVEWEIDVSKGSLDVPRIQDAINPKLKECQIAYVLFYSKAGEFTIEELNLAQECCPKTFVYFKTGFSTTDRQKNKEYDQVLEIREQLEKANKLLFTDYDGETAFKLHFKDDLNNHLHQTFPASNSPNRKPDSPKSKISVSALPTLQPHFTGREKELALLDAAWADPNANIVQFIAPGGTGKTTLVTYWLENQIPKDTADVIYAWSFYSQGTDDHKQSSSDLFFQRAMDFLEEKEMPTDPRERGRALANALRRQRCLLILDGIEPLQHPPGPLEGELKDPALKALFRELVFAHPGLCILTTRIFVRELEGQPEPRHRPCNLENLDEASGVALLRSIGVNGSAEALRSAVRDYDGHALSLRLLGNYLVEVYDGDVKKCEAIRRHLIEEEISGNHAQHVMEAYVTWFSENHTGNGIAPEVALLQLLGLFDRPAPVAALDTLLAEPDISGLTEGLRELDQARIKKALNHLKKLGLLTENLPFPGTISKELRNLPMLRHLESLDAHPLVREHFGQRLENRNPTAWREANARLYDYYCQLPEKHLPDTLEEMEPLFLAMAHGCRAGKQQEVVDEVYWERIKRKGDQYTWHNLGAFGSDLTSLAHLFERVWEKPSSNMTEADQAWVLGQAGFGLRGLGRLREASEPMKASLERRIEQKNWSEAALNASNLSQLFLSLGNLLQAVEYGRLSVEYADRSEDDFQKESKRTIHANALHQSSNLKEADRLFTEALAMQQKRQPSYHYLYSVQGYYYCDLLLGMGKWEEVLKQTSVTLEWVKQQNWLLDIALDQLSLGRANLAKAQAEKTTNPETGKWLNSAVEGLRKAGAVEFIAKGLLARAAWHRYEGRYNEAHTDLQETLEIAESGSMGLYLVDYHIEMSRLRTAEGQPEEAAQHKAEALRRIKETGYLRRLKEAEEL
jgi:tetratricopeptide (TPR) repeat protein